MLVFVVNEAGRCVYYFYGRGEGVVLFSYVGDVLIFGISLNLIKEVKDFLFNNFVLSPCSQRIAHSCSWQFNPRRRRTSTLVVHVRLLSYGCSQDCIAYLVLHRLWSTISVSSLCRLVGTKSRPWSCLRVYCYNSNCFISFYMINITSTDRSHVHMLVKNILLSFWIKLYSNLPKYLHMLHRGTSTTLGHFSSCELSVRGVHMLGESRL